MLGQNKFLSNGAILRPWGRSLLRPYRRLSGPDTRGEATNGREVKIFVEPDGGMILRGDGQRQFTKFHGAQSFRGSLHKHAAKAVSLIPREDADLRGVPDAGGDFAGQHGGD